MNSRKILSFHLQLLLLMVYRAVYHFFLSLHSAVFHLKINIPFLMFTLLFGNISENDENLHLFLTIFGDIFTSILKSYKVS